jgi:hypothetical protein
MNVNARGDRLDSNNEIVEPKNQQTQRRYQKQTNVSAGPAHSSARSATAAAQQPVVDPTDSFLDLPIDEPLAESAPEAVVPTPEPVADQDQQAAAVPAQGGGLAGAIARSREVKQELEKTRRQQAQAQGVRRI